MKKMYENPEASVLPLSFSENFLLSTATGNSTENITEEDYDGDWS